MFVQAPPAILFSHLTDFEHFASEIPSDRIHVTKMSSGPYRIGTIVHTETGFKIKIEWNSRVVDIQDNHLLLLQFLDGISRGGNELWELQFEGFGTFVTHTIVYNIVNPLYRSLWVLKRGEARHDALVEATLMNLKRSCERQTEIAATDTAPQNAPRN